MTPFDVEWRLGPVEFGWCREWKTLRMGEDWRHVGPLWWRIRRGAL